MKNIESERGKELIRYKNYKFFFKELNQKRHKWRCIEKYCKY